MVTNRKISPLLRLYLKHVLLLLGLSRGLFVVAYVRDGVDGFEQCSQIHNKVLDGASKFFHKKLENKYLPSHGKDPKPIFMCYSYQSPNFPEYVTNANFSDWDIDRSGFDAQAQTVIVLHGFKETGDDWLKRTKDAFFNRYKCNVITVVWGQPESSYEEEKTQITATGKDIAFFIENLVVSKNIDVQDIYLIGKSLGAHLAGIIGKEIKRKLNSKVGRITGLDPAGPDYYSADATERLDLTDASFVDVIHTNAACTRVNGMGYPYSLGHFDFYVNGGSKQPGCKDANEYMSEMTSQEWKSTLNYLFGPVDSETFEAVDKYLLCNHIRALDVFLASVENESCEFMARECSSWSRYLSGECDNHDVVAMGHSADKYKKLINNSSQMKFYLKTDAIYPYCL